MLSGINIEQLGTAGVIVAILLWQNFDLRKHIRRLEDQQLQANLEFQKQLAEANKQFQDQLKENITAFRDMREVFQLLREKL